MKHNLLLIIAAVLVGTISCQQEKELSSVAVSSVSLNTSSLTLTEGESETLQCTILPENAANQSVSWSSSSPDVASVQNGTIKAHKAGTATISVTTEDGGKTASCEVTVKQRTASGGNDAIVFADDVMKSLCVTAFDTNGDGELSYKEAAAVTDLSLMPLIKRTFKSFDEFQYFINVKIIPDSYFSGIGIKSIVLPESLKLIRESAFKGCALLAEILIPESVTTIEGYTFSGCSSLASITIPESVTSIGECAFNTCI